MPQTMTSQEPGTQEAETSSPVLFESWGRYPTYSGKIVPLNWQGDFPDVADGIHNGALPVGMGRSYGDVCLLRDGNILLTTAMTAPKFQTFYPQWEHFARFRDPMLTSSFWERVTGDQSTL
jgi:hypothetical protein